MELTKKMRVRSMQDSVTYPILYEVLSLRDRVPARRYAKLYCIVDQSKIRSQNSVIVILGRAIDSNNFMNNNSDL